jgi:replicative DNA helicase
MSGWEKALIGTALADPAKMEDAADIMPQDLTGCHQQIWAEMIILHRSGNLGPRALIEILRDRKMLSSLGFVDTSKGEAYIAELLQSRGDEMPEYVDRVIQASVKRNLRDAAALIRAEAMDENITAQEALDNAETRVIQLRRSKGRQGLSAGDLMNMLSQRRQRQLDGTFVPGWTPKIQALRREVGWFEETDDIIIAGRPGDGKSSVLRYELGMAAWEDNLPVLLINMENDEIEIARNLISMVSGVSKMALKDGNLTDAQVEAVNRAVDGWANAPFHVETMASPSGRQVVATARKYIAQKGIKLLGIDYVQLMSNGRKDLREDVTVSSNAIRSISLGYKIPTLVACQMSRNIEHRGKDAEPVLADLRESGSLEQDATVVIFVRPVWANPSPAQLAAYPENRMGGGVIVNKAVPMRFIIAKNRNGPLATTKEVLFVKDRNTYRTLEEE